MSLVSSVGREITAEIPQAGDVEGRVEEVADGAVSLSLALTKGSTEAVSAGSEVVCHWVDSQGVWSQRSKVIGTAGPSRQWLRVKPEGEPYKTQRREAFRLKVSLDVTVTSASSRYQATTRDLSVTGMCVEMWAAGPAEGEVVDVSFSYDDTSIECQASVERQDRDGAMSVLGLQFLDMEAAESEHLSEYITRAQLEQRRRAK